MLHEFSFPMPIIPALHIDQSQTPDEFGVFGRQWYAQVEKRSACGKQICLCQSLVKLRS
ncbi:hypothetical protein CPB84DRAFT_1784561 [Gymnopilus junonius]|uniref:Uncharacterized protein n=1 Tax=Gymnopilus junonius TaxID=109634 RepID=A0A9P5NJL5_GYMJU|nr:hypothetical protein CPB84DRAFT_1784561 [Gymnopilus junonius]